MQSSTVMGPPKFHAAARPTASPGSVNGTRAPPVTYITTLNSTIHGSHQCTAKKSHPKATHVCTANYFIAQHVCVHVCVCIRVCVRAEEGNPCTSPSAQQQRWQRHFSGVLNMHSQFDCEELERVRQRPQTLPGNHHREN